MEAFGWNLQGRQEIHQEGDAEGKPSLTGSKYVITVKISHYVKLHFVRSLGTPNLDRVRKLEAEYLGMTFPEYPSLKGPVGLVVFGVLALVVAIASFSDPHAPSAGVFVVALLFGAGGGAWLKSRLAKRSQASEQISANTTRRAELMAEAQRLLVQSPGAAA
jgi:hypothetical protein